MVTLPPQARLMAALSFVFAAGCAGGASTGLTPSGSAAVLRQALHDAKLQTPALISIDLGTSELVYWPTKNGSGQSPIPFTKALGIVHAYAMAANGDTIVVTNQNPAEIVTYNVKTKKTSTHKDSYGDPYDVAIDKKGNIYAMGVGNVTVYAAGTYKQSRLECSTIDKSVAIGVDNEGDVFVNGYGVSFFGVIEYAAGSKKCKSVKIQQEQGYAGGVGVDPNTDDLIVIDNPDECAGGYEGRMTIYPKPYRATKFTQANLNATYCGGTFRLDKGSKHIYVSDSTVSAGWPLYDERSYPTGAGNGYYSTNYGGETGGFTPLPSALPN